MSEDESLDAAEQRLQAALAEVREKKRLKDMADRAEREEAERKRLEEEREGPVTITFASVKSNNRIEFILSRTRWDIDNELRYLTGRTFTNRGLTNELPVVEFGYFKDRMSKFKNVTVVASDEFNTAYAELVEGPNFVIDLVAEHEFKITTGPFAKLFVFNNIMNCKRRAGSNIWTVPVSDLDSMVEAFKDKEKVKFTERAEIFISETLAKNNLLDAIALKEDSDIVVDLNGHTLKNFQKVGVEFAEATNINLIIADEMGLGKTPQAIAIAKRAHGKRWLVICPASLKTNWVREIEKFTNEKALVFAGAAPDDSDIIRMLTDKRKFVVVNYDMIARKIVEKTKYVDETGRTVNKERDRWLWVDLINMAGFDGMITDETHYIKNTGSLRSRATREIKVPHHILLTGTPVLNRPSELWPMLALAAPTKFPSEDAFKARYTHDGNEGRNIPELRKLMKPFMIRRLKKDVVKELEPINRITEWHTLSAEAQKKYDKVLDGVYEVIGTFDKNNAGDEQNITTILTEIMRCKQVAADDKIERIAEMAFDAYESADENEPNKKVIIFSQFQGAVHAIGAQLGHEAVYFDGTVPMKERTRLQDEFQDNDKVKYLVTTMKVAGEGLNLTRAGTVIFNDLGWTPAIHEQAEARAYGRLSNLHSITSKYLLAENTLDTWIWELLEAKMRIITEVVEGVQSDRDASSSIVKDLIRRLKDMR